MIGRSEAKFRASCLDIVRQYLDAGTTVQVLVVAPTYKVARAKILHMKTAMAPMAGFMGVPLDQVAIFKGRGIDQRRKDRVGAPGVCFIYDEIQGETNGR